jgi:hypothetical protein
MEQMVVNTIMRRRRRAIARRGAVLVLPCKYADNVVSPTVHTLLKTLGAVNVHALIHGKLWDADRSKRA